MQNEFIVSATNTTSGGGSTSTFIDVVLLASAWDPDTRQQTVVANGVTATNNIYTQAPVNREQFLSYGDAAISCISQDSDTLIFECSLIPSIDIHIKVEISN